MTGHSEGTTTRISRGDGALMVLSPGMTPRPESISLKDRIISSMRVENFRSKDPETGIPEVRLRYSNDNYNPQEHGTA